MTEMTVVVPTLGRLPELERCLQSITDCDPLPVAVVVMDQSGDGAVDAMAARIAQDLIRVEHSSVRGIAVNINRGVSLAETDVIAVTHDDCTVDRNWIGALGAHLSRHGTGLVTGRVMPVGNPARVPSIRTDPDPSDHVSGARYDLLMAANMACYREEILAIGGFDEREGFRSAAEDLDLCYRWTRAGLPVWYRPDAVVWHHDWRTEEQLVHTYQSYARAKGVFYVKYLREGDPAPWRWIRRNLTGSLRSQVSGLRGRPAWTDHRRPLLVHMPRGLVAGWREDRRISQRAATPGPPRHA
jgi:GT2 family glycosyltransferase